MQSPDHPDLVYLEARKTSGRPMYTVGRPSGPPLWVVIHDMESNESASCAENTAEYFHDGAGGRSVSAHYCADDNSIVQCVLLQNSAWTVGNTQGNNRGINWELCGFASQTRDQWLDDFGEAMLRRAAPYMISDMKRFGIPVHHCTVDELKAMKPGVTSHNDLRLAFGGTTHTDPGVNFPWDYLMALLEGGGVPTSQEKHAYNAASNAFAETYGNDTAAFIANPDPVLDPLAMIHSHFVVTTLKDMKEQLDRIEAKIDAGGGGGAFIPHEHTTDEGTPT